MGENDNVSISLIAEVNGDMNPDIVSASAIVFWVGLPGNVIYTIIRVNQESKRNKSPLMERKPESWMAIRCYRYP